MRNHRTFGFWCGALTVWMCASLAAHATLVDDIVAQVSQSSYSNYLAGTDFLYTHAGNNRNDHTANHSAAMQNIYNTFGSFGLTASYDLFGTGTNVVAVKTGTVHPEQVYIIGAHYDSVGNAGADDNASGVAAVLEAARVLADFQFEATLRFVAFDREEDGLIGSTAYAAAHAGDNILGMLSLDMIAYNAPSRLNTALLYGRSASDPLKLALSNAISLYGEGITVSDLGQFDASDHAPFEARGFQAALLIEGAMNRYLGYLNPNYHTANDNVDQAGYIDYLYATRMTRSAVGWLATDAGLLNVPEPSLLFLLAVGGLIIAARSRARRC
jgi:Zn-dependent M28 family amino/carboxypeptidase